VVRKQGTQLHVLADRTGGGGAPPAAEAGIAEPAKASTASGAESAARVASSDAAADRLTNILR
jgi:hypothetical protein